MGLNADLSVEVQDSVKAVAPLLIKGVTLSSEVAASIKTNFSVGFNMSRRTQKN